MLVSTRHQRPNLVLFADGKASRCQVYIYQGACLAGDPTTYVIRNGEMVWVKPGESCEFVEAT